MGVKICRKLPVFAISALLCWGVVAAPAPVWAQAPTAEAQANAKMHYGNGKKFYEQGNFVEAMAEFQAAYDAKPHPTVLKSIAECKVQVGDLLGAISVFEKYLADPVTKPEDKGVVQARLAEIRAMLPSLEVSSQPPGAGIVIDGTLSDKTTPAVLLLNPGNHDLTLNSDGFEPLARQVALANAQKTTLAVDFAKEGTPLPTPAAAAPPGGEGTIVDPFAEKGEPGPASEPAPVAEESAGPPPAFWICAAVAGVGIVSGTVFGTMALSDEKTYEDDPTQDNYDTGKTDALIADVSFGVAAAAAIVGAIILFTGGETEAGTSTSRSVQVVPVANAETVGASASVSF